MRRKVAEKQLAIKLRRQGLSYSEIREHLPIAKSTLSVWLKSIPLTKTQRKRLRQKGGQFLHLAQKAHKQKRIEKTKTIIHKARSEIYPINKDILHIIGSTLYWAEGQKQKKHNPSACVIFSNSDPFMIKIYLKWLQTCLKIPSSRLTFEIYIHKTYKSNKSGLINYWSSVTGFPAQRFDKIRYKKNKVHSYRKNRGNNYWGVLRIRLRKSTDLNRKITGWIEGICIHCGVV